MRALSLLRLTVFACALGGTVALGLLLFGGYWSDVRQTVAYDLARQGRAAQGSDREKLLSDALSIDGGNWLANLTLAQDRLFSGQLSEAEQLLDVAVRRNPRSPLANYVMGIVQYRLGSAKAALPYFEAAAALDPGNTQYEGMVKQLQDSVEGGSQSGAATSTTTP
jgi:tetratricopeptide (TPR) repeat protein